MIECKNCAFSMDSKKGLPISMGAGLVALDVVISKHKNEAKCWVGGSCGNFLTILAYFGWQSIPIAYVGKDQASEIMLDDLHRWGVKTDFIITSKSTSTPIIVERIKSKNQLPSHVFEFKCPFCGSHLPRNKPLPKFLLESFTEKLPPSNVFYFDRVSTTILKLASIQKSKGALVVFEPHRVTERELFNKCLELADIVKYSSEQINSIKTEVYAPLEIQTLGAKGLKYRMKNGERSGEWRRIESFQAQEIVDSAGAGDWCTAGLIHYLWTQGSTTLQLLDQGQVENALKFGQCLSAIKCSYEGPRGIMYSIEKSKLKYLAGTCYSQNSIPKAHIEQANEERQDHTHICPHCATRQKNSTVMF